MTTLKVRKISILALNYTFSGQKAKTKKATVYETGH